jgi:hypothetical protein
MREATHLRYLPRVDQLIDDEKIIEAKEFLLKEWRVNIGRIHEVILYVFAGASGHGYATKIEREEGVVAEIVHLNRHFSCSPENSLFLLLKIVVSDFRDTDSIVEDGLTYSLLLHVLKVLLEEEVTHRLVAFVDRSPILDHNVTLRKRTTERYC